LATSVNYLTNLHPSTYSHHKQFHHAHVHTLLRPQPNQDVGPEPNQCNQSLFDQRTLLRGVEEDLKRFHTSKLSTNASEVQTLAGPNLYNTANLSCLQSRYTVIHLQSATSL
jgi:hypothetical protein